MDNTIKDKILKRNIISTNFVLVLITILSFVITVIIIYEKNEIEINLIKKSYIENQKNLMKHQINNLINLINTLRKEKLKSIKNDLKTINNTTTNILTICNKNKYKTVLKNLDKENPFIFFTLSDLNANLIYTHLKDYNKTKRKKLITKMLKKNMNEIYFTHKTPKGLKITYQHIFKNYLFSTCTYQHIIDKFVKRRIIQVIYKIRFGPNNNGYISIAEILNYKGGKNFAKVVALPVNPKMVGKLLSDDKKDAKGNYYRKQYLKIINSTGEGYVSYWFYKYSDKIIRPKISYVKLYKPWNWLIFTNVFIDDINKVIKKKKEMLYQELLKLTCLYFVLFIIVYFVTKKIIKSENLIIDKTITNYEQKINKQHIALKNMNHNLQKEIEKKSEELIKSYFTDNLTNLPNREQLINDLKNNFIAIINIDDFKEINDFYGVEKGDKILKEFALFLNSIYPTYKLSADEYALIAQTPAKLKHITTKIIKELNNKKFDIDDEKIKLSISVGIGKTLAEADIALKYAKNSKKQIIVYNKRLPVLKEFENNLKWKKIINVAIEKDNIIPYVQAIVNNKTKEIEKYECLMRLKHKDKIYTPFHFLEIAKKTHQYEMLQKIMIEKCFSKFSKLSYNFSINISTNELENVNFITFLINKIDEYNIVNKLTIEILEDEDLVENKKINHIIHTLSKKGIKIAIDDFGSGYSNFVYLIKNLPISTLKIDGSLVKDILKDEKLKKLLLKIVEIANEFEFETIAEYVENEELYIELKNLKVYASQGYYFSKPFNIGELS